MVIGIVMEGARSSFVLTPLLFDPVSAVRHRASQPLMSAIAAAPATAGARNT